MSYKLISKKKKHKLLNDAESAAVGLATPFVSGAIIDKTIGTLSKKFIKGDHELSNEDISNIYKHVGGKKKLHFGSMFSDINDENVLKLDPSASKPYMASSYNDNIGNYTDKSPAVYFSRNAPESVVANQMAQITSPTLKNSNLLTTYSVSRLLGAAIPGLAGVRYATARSRGADKKTLDKIKKQDDIAAVATSLPGIAESTRNNLMALKAVKKMGKLNKRNVIPLALSELTYLSAPTLTPLTHKLIDTYYDWRNKKQKKQNHIKVTLI